MKLVALLSLLLFQAADENPMIPKYPFKSARLTFKMAKVHGADLATILHVKGSKVATQTIHTFPDKSVQEAWHVFDGTTCFTLVKKGEKVVSATKAKSLAAFVGEQLAKLPAEMKAAFKSNLESVWDRYASVMGSQTRPVGEKIKLKAATQKIAGKECVGIETGKEEAVTLWRWKGTDLFLKVEYRAATLEVEKIEEDVAVDDALFAVPAGVDLQLSYEEGINRDMAALVVKQFARDPLAGTLAAEINGKKIKVGGLEASLVVEAKATHLVIKTEIEGEWDFYVSLPVDVKAIKELDGKSLTLKHVDGISEAGFESEAGGEHVAKEVTLKVVRATDLFLELKVSGTWEVYGTSEVTKIPEFTLTVPVMP